jgi:hypothetical protein
MYRKVGNITVITLEAWLQAGLTKNQFYNDSRRGQLNIVRRSRHGQTLIELGSIREDRMLRIQERFGKIEDAVDALKAEIIQLKEQQTKLTEMFSDFIRQLTALPVNITGMASSPSAAAADESGEVSSVWRLQADPNARTRFLSRRRQNGSTLEAETVERYTNRAHLLYGIREVYHAHVEARATRGKKASMGEFYQTACRYYLEWGVKFPCDPITNPRSFERVFKAYLKDGYDSIINGNIDNDNRKKISKKADRLLLALYKRKGQPFIEDVHADYHEFVNGGVKFFDRETGEIFNPSDFRCKGKPLDISLPTVWNHLRKGTNAALALKSRLGNFDFNNNRSPFRERKHGTYSLSKFTLDDTSLSRRSYEGTVTPYVAWDVVSGYRFRPAYCNNTKPSISTVTECIRNMMAELASLALPVPYEADTERHLIKNMDWLGKVFTVVNMNESARGKRAENFNRQYKYGVQKKHGHMNNRHYGKGAYKGSRLKENGEFPDKKYDFATLVSDDLHDTESWNNSLHPDQKTYPGMTRKEVLIRCVNPKCEAIAPYYHYRYFGQAAETSIVNCKRIRAFNSIFWLKDTQALNLLKPNSFDVTAYCLPSFDDGSVETACLYQGDTYIGEAVNMESKRYNECRAEETDTDRENRLYQEKQISKFHKAIKDLNAELPRLGVMEEELFRRVDELKAEIPDSPADTGRDEGEMYDCMNEDYAARGIEMA